MKAPTNQTGLIKPFNLDPADYENMFSASPPRQVIVTVSIAAMPELCEHHARSGFNAVVKQLYGLLGGKAIEPLPTPVKGLMPLLQLERFPTPLIDIMTDAQKAWVHDSFYVQTGIQEGYDTQHINFSEGILWGMTVLDNMVSLTGSTNPKDHKPIAVTEITGRFFRYRVNELFQDRVGIWCSTLVDYRTMVQIKCHAVQMGRDPDLEYDRFIQAGGKYFLEYPVLCP